MVYTLSYGTVTTNLAIELLVVIIDEGSRTPAVP